MKKMPKAGSWMNEIKYVGGVIEIAAAFKFLAISDFAWSWGIIGRSFCLSLWALGALFCALYISGIIRFKSDVPVQGFSAIRWIIALSFLALALWLFMGFIGFTHLGVVEAWFPGDPAPVMNS